MVDSAAKAVGEWAGKLVMDELRLLRGVESKVEILQNQLLWMEACLADVNMSGDKSFVLRLYVSQVKGLVKESQDVIQTYVDEILKEDGSGGNLLNKSVNIIKTFQPRHKVDSKINHLTQKMSLLEKNLKFFRGDVMLDRGTRAQDRGLGNGKQAEEGVVAGGQQAQGTAPIGELNQSLLDLPRFQHEKEQEEDYPDGHLISGRLKEEKEVIDYLVNSEAEVRFVTVRGVRGIGKTTLAELIRENEKIKKHFNRKCYWVHASGPGHLDYSLFLRRLYGSVVGDIGERDYDGLTAELESALREAKRCLVVVDGVADAKLLEEIVKFFSLNMNQGSKVLLTMRDQKLAKSINPREAKDYPLVGMAETEGWELLERTMQWHELDDDATRLLNQMLEKCDGNPWAIVKLGMKCAGKDIEEWEAICNMVLMTLYPERRFEHALETNYNMLPDSVKPCALHLCHFPDDYHIPVPVVVRMWIAEGYVSSLGDGSTLEESLEDLARDMLNKLVELSLVQLHHSSGDQSTQRMESVTMHKLVRNFLSSKALKKDLIHLIQPKSTQWPYNCKIMAIYFDETLDSLDGASKLECKQQLSSLVAYPVKGFMDLRSRMEDKCQKFLKDACREFKRLKMLHLQGLPLGGTFPEEIKNLRFLRYLGLKGTYITEVPSSVGSLMFLQILDLRVCCTDQGKVVIIPNTICNATRLVCLFLPAVSYDIKEKNQVLRLHTLCCLETVKNVDVSKCQIRDLGRLKKMRSLSLKLMKFSKKDTLKDVLSSLTSSKDLQRLSIRVQGAAITEKSGKKLQHALLYRLDVEGTISKPLSVKMFLQGLEVLKLESSRLKDDPMLVLMWLPKLRSLSLGKNSFLGKTIVSGADGFAQLKKLKFQSLLEFREWIVEEGALPILGQLVIDNCQKLTTRPRYLRESVRIIGKKFIESEEDSRSDEDFWYSWSDEDFWYKLISLADCSFNLVIKEKRIGLELKRSQKDKRRGIYRADVAFS